jgi:hypothetical protein
MENISAITNLMASSNNKIEELLAANQEFSRKVRDSENKCQDLLHKLEEIEQEDEATRNKNQL